ncbi:sugar ABC transporter ATP-binding protein, partial [Pseudomonas aeruginosa]
LLNGKSVERLGFRQRMALGMALVPEDRQAEGLVQMMSIKANMTLASLVRNALRPLAAAGECALVDDMIEKLAIKVSDRELPITSLSGGNQQKVVLGKA